MNLSCSWVAAVNIYSPLQYIHVVLIVPRKTKLSKWWAILLLWSSMLGRDWWMDSRDHKPDTTPTSNLFCTLAASFLSQYRPSRTRTRERERERVRKAFHLQIPFQLSSFGFYFFFGSLSRDLGLLSFNFSSRIVCYSYGFFPFSFFLLLVAFLGQIFFPLLELTDLRIAPTWSYCLC